MEVLNYNSKQNFCSKNHTFKPLAFLLLSFFLSFSLSLNFVCVFWFGRSRGRESPSRKAKDEFCPLINHLVIIVPTWTNRILPKLRDLVQSHLANSSPTWTNQRSPMWPYLAGQILGQLTKSWSILAY